MTLPARRRWWGRWRRVHIVIRRRRWRVHGIVRMRVMAVRRRWRRALAAGAEQGREYGAADNFLHGVPFIIIVMEWRVSFGMVAIC
jgi:hypothetical protein